MYNAGSSMITIFAIIIGITFSFDLDKEAQVVKFACAVLTGNSAMSVDRQQLILRQQFFRLLKLLLEGDSTFVPRAKTPSNEEACMRREMAW